MKADDIIRSFGFEIPSQVAPESIYPYAPVYRVDHAGRDWIVKHTASPLARGQSVARWTQSLASRGIGIVSPASGFGENPRSFRSDHEDAEEVWVVYPFIEGAPYSGELPQILAAGELLGQIHSAGMRVDFGLKVSETVVAIAMQELEEDTAKIAKCLQTFFPDLVDMGLGVLRERMHMYLENALPGLLQTQLPLSNCSWDYKADNLVYESEAAPVLVDPDNTGRIPRVYDLAIAALLFHHVDAPLAPRRVFTRPEWLVFLSGYFRDVQLTEQEESMWDHVLLCAWIDEAVWLLTNYEEAWANPSHSQLLLSLLLTDLSTFALSQDP